jgi:L-iditol 2-dehydrogenase
MRAAVLYGKEDIRLEEIPTPLLKPGEVRVSIQAALTCGTDLKVYKRGYHARMIVPPSVFGHELSGVISEVHPETRDWQVGDRVVPANSAPCGQCVFCLKGQENLCDDLIFLNGAYAQEIIIPARIVEKNLLRLHGSTRFADAALTEPLACVVQGVNDLGLSGSERILVLGTGPIGLMFVALCKHFGSEVIAAGRGEKRLQTAARLGASVIALASDQEIPPQIERRDFDVVIEAIGKPETWEAAVQLVRRGGMVNLFGGCPSGTFARFDTGLILYSNLKLLASFHHTPRSIRQALSFIQEGVISSRDFVDGSSSLDELPQLFRSMALGNKSIKTLISVR